MLYQNYLSERKETLGNIKRFIDKYNPCQQYAGFVKAQADFEKKLIKLRSIDGNTAGNPAATKKRHRENLSKEAALMCKLLFAYASANKNIALKNAIQYTYSDFFRPVENTMLGRCRQVLSAARKIKNGADFAITPHSIQSLETALKAYKDVMHEPQVKIIKHARAYKQQDKLITECLFIAHTQMAPFIELDCKENSSLYEYFKDMCKIRKTAGRKRKYTRKPKPAITVMPMSINLIAPHYIHITKPQKSKRLQLART